MREVTDDDRRGPTANGCAYLGERGWTMRGHDSTWWWNEPGTKASRQYPDAIRMEEARRQCVTR